MSSFKSACWWIFIKQTTWIRNCYCWVQWMKYWLLHKKFPKNHTAKGYLICPNPTNPLLHNRVNSPIDTSWILQLHSYSKLKQTMDKWFYLLCLTRDLSTNNANITYSWKVNERWQCKHDNYTITIILIKCKRKKVKRVEYYLYAGPVCSSRTEEWHFKLSFSLLMTERVNFMRGRTT